VSDTDGLEDDAGALLSADTAGNALARAQITMRYIYGCAKTRGIQTEAIMRNRA
jgi:hypothetical protein